MQARFILVPALVITSPVHATVFMSVEQAQAVMFPGETMTPHFIDLSDAQISKIEDASDTDVLVNHLRAWRASGGGWFIADQVVGKHDFIPFALALSADGSVKDIEILEYREAYGGDVCNPKWLAQFKGKHNGSTLALTQDIQNISGATLSSKHITDGVRRLLATYAVALAPH